MFFHRIFRYVGVIPALIVAEILFAAMVYESNRAVQAQALAVQARGLLASAGGAVLAELGGVGAAVGGGVFFTLTIGLGLVLLARGARWWWVSAQGRYRSWGGWVLGGIWVGAGCFLNSRGFLLWPTLAVAIVPVVAVKWGRSRDRAVVDAVERRLRWLPLLVVTVALVWMAVAGNGAFFRIRDRVLLPNQPGLWVADTYYRYTLFAARVFTPIAGRPQVGVYVASDPTAAPVSDVLTAVAPFGWVRIDDSSAAAVRLEVENRQIVWRVGRRRINGGSTSHFLADPRAAVAALSKSVDIYGPLRLLVLISLLAASPAGLLWAVWAGFVRVMRLFASPIIAQRSATVASALAMAVGLAVVMWPLPGLRPETNLIGLSAWDQVAVLQRAAAGSGPLPAPAVAGALAESPNAAVRLALVAAMDRRCRRSDGPLLESLLADPHAIIVTAAVRVLGHCRHKESVPVLSDVYRRTDHWYVQDATFRALRGLK